jgi:accessory gene regulator B
MIEAVALRLAEAIKRMEPEKTASVPVMKFALEAVLNTLITLGIIVIVGCVTGSLGHTLLAAACFSILRFFSGGLHFAKAVHCSIVSTCLIVAAPHIALNIQWLIAVTVLSLLLVLIFAPSNIRGHARIPEKYFPVLKIAAALIVCSNFIFLDSTVALVFLCQAVTIVNFKKEVRT